MSEMATMPIRTINASSLCNIGSGSHDERDHNVLEHKNPRMTIPLQTATTILLFQVIEKRISVLRHGCQKLNQQQEIASESNRLIEVGPELEIDCRV